MRYSAEPKFGKYIKEFGILSFARKFGDKYGKKLMDAARQTGIDAAKTASKRTQEFDVIQFFLNHLQFSNVSTDTTVILKEKMLNEKST